MRLHKVTHALVQPPLLYALNCISGLATPAGGCHGDILGARPHDGTVVPQFQMSALPGTPLAFTPHCVRLTVCFTVCFAVCLDTDGDVYRSGALHCPHEAPLQWQPKPKPQAQQPPAKKKRQRQQKRWVEQQHGPSRPGTTAAVDGSAPAAPSLSWGYGLLTVALPAPMAGLDLAGYVCVWSIANRADVEVAIASAGSATELADALTKHCVGHCLVKALLPGDALRMAPYGNVAVVATLEEQDAVHKDIMVDDDDVVAFVEVLRALSANFARSSNKVRILPV